MENVRFEVYREGGPKRVVRLALVDGIDSNIYLVTKSIDGKIENVLLELDRDTGIFHLVEAVCDDTGLPLDGRGRIVIKGFNDGDGISCSRSTMRNSSYKRKKKTICEYKQIIIDLFKWSCATPTQWEEMAQAVLEASEAGKTPGIDEEFVLPEKYDYIYGLTDYEYKQIIIDLFKRGHATSTQWEEMAQAVLEASEVGKTPKINEKLILQEKYDYICGLTKELVSGIAPRKGKGP